MASFQASFGVLDYVVFIATLIISFGIGIATAFKGNQTPEDFLMGGRSLGAIPVALSLLITFISAINFVGYTSELYINGIQMSMMTVGAVLGILVAGVITLPVLHPLKLTSTHEYIELRFKSSRLRFCMMLMIVSQGLVFMGVCLYAPSIALAAITPLDYISYIFIMGVVCTIYSTIGGIRAVVWTDVFQFVIIIIGAVIIVVVGTMKTGGIGSVFSVALNGGRLEVFNMNPSIYERHNFYNTIAFGFFFYSALYGVSQVNVQRICAVSTIKEAKSVLGLNVVGQCVFHGLVFYIGLLIYATYAGCDPFLEGKIPKREAILSYFIVDQMGFIPGLPGIFVATLTASTLSTFSSVLNAQVALVWTDFLTQFELFSQLTPKTAGLMNKILTFVMGAIYIGMAILTSKTQSIIQLVMTLGGIAFGSIYGVFLLGMCFPVCNSKGAWAGLIGSYAFNTWIYIGSMLYGTPPTPLPFTTDHCFNVSLSVDSTVDLNNSVYSILLHNQTQIEIDSRSSTENFPLLYLYDISYTLYSVIGPVLCIVLGIIVSYLTGAQDGRDVPLQLITPFVRKFYKKEDDQLGHSELTEKPLPKIRT